MRFPESTSDDVVKRLRRLEGQVRGLQRLVEEGAECRDVVTQLNAAKGALDRVGFTLMAAAMRDHLTDGESDHEAMAELERLFLTLS